MKRTRGAVQKFVNSDVKRLRGLRNIVGRRTAVEKSLQGNIKTEEPVEAVFIKCEVPNNELENITEFVHSNQEHQKEAEQASMTSAVDVLCELTDSEGRSLRFDPSIVKKEVPVYNSVHEETSANIPCSTEVSTGQLEHIAIKEEPMDCPQSHQLSSEVRYLHCCICSYVSRHLSTLLKHYSSAHEHESNFIVTCGIGGCISSYSVVAALRRHIHRKHKKEIDIYEGIEDEEIEADDTDREASQCFEENVAPLPQYIDEITACILQISEKHNIPKQTSAAIIEKFEGLVNRCIEDTNDTIETNNFGLTPHQKSLLMCPIIKLSESLSACNTVHKQVMLFHKYGLVCPEGGEIIMSRSINGTVTNRTKERDTFSDHIENEPVFIESHSIGHYFIEYNGRKVLLNHDPQNQFVPCAIQELKNHGINVPSEECRMELYDKDHGIYYSIKEKDLPGNGLVKLIFDNQPLSMTSVCNGQNTSTSNLSQPSLQHHSQSTDAILGQNEDDESMDVNEFGGYGVRSWPKQFIIQDKRISETLKTSLQSKVIPTKKEQSALLEFLYQEITRYTYYPTPRNYDEVATALLRRFPHLQECSSFADAKELWKIRLSTKARNSRRRKDQLLPVVVEKRARREATVGENTYSNKSKPGYGAPNYLPKKLTSEDHASIESHVDFLKCESSKTCNKDLQKIEVSMNETFYHRRELIVVQNATIPALREIYPVLFDSIQLCFEFTRITEIDIITAMRAKLMEYADGILEVSSTPYRRNTSLSVEDQEELLACKAIRKIPVLMKETLDFTSAAPEVLSPMVVFESSNLLPTTPGKLVAGGEEVCVFEGPLMGMAVWLASYYCFDCCYPKSCSKTLRFLQRAMLGLKDATKAHVTVMSIFHKIKQAKQSNMVKTSDQLDDQ